MLTIDDIKNVTDHKHKMKKELYTKLYEDLSKKIRLAASLNQKCTVVTLPGFVFGFPVYDVKKAIGYLQRQFELSGFSAVILSDHDLLVSWVTPKTPSEVPIVEETETSFENLTNLRKMANKYKRAH